MTRPAAHVVNPLDPERRTPAKVAPALVNAYNARGSGRSPGPMLHASPNPPVPSSASGATYRAVCGATVRNVTRVAWSPYGPGRRCPACVAGPRPR